MYAWRATYKSCSDQRLHVTGETASCDSETSEEDGDLVGATPTHDVGQSAVKRRECTCCQQVSVKYKLGAESGCTAMGFLRCSQPTCLMCLVEL